MYASTILMNGTDLELEYQFGTLVMLLGKMKDTEHEQHQQNKISTGT